MTFYFLYKTTCQTTGKYYFGMHKTENLEDGYFGSGLILKNYLRKYGKENFKREILSFFKTYEDLKKGEEKLITEITLKDPNCLNLVTGGGGGIGPGRLGFRKGADKFSFLMKNNLEFRKKMKNILKKASTYRKIFRCGPLSKMTYESSNPGS